MRDISSRPDIQELVEEFYRRLLENKELAPVFSGIALEEHLPRIVHFWSFVLLDESGYKTNVFEKHMHLPIKPHHFQIWLAIFISTVDALFAGEIADTAKQRATTLAYTFESKWDKIHPKE